MEKVSTAAAVHGKGSTVIRCVVEPSHYAFFGKWAVTIWEVEASVHAIFGRPVVVLLDLPILKIKEYDMLAQKIWTWVMRTLTGWLTALSNENTYLYSNLIAVASSASRKDTFFLL